MENKLQEIIGKIDRAKTCIHVEIFIDRRPCVMVNGIDATAFLNPFALKKLLRTTIMNNSRQAKLKAADAAVTIKEEEK